MRWLSQISVTLILTFFLIQVSQSLPTDKLIKKRELKHSYAGVFGTKDDSGDGITIDKLISANLLYLKKPRPDRRDQPSKVNPLLLDVFAALVDVRPEKVPIVSPVLPSLYDYLFEIPSDADQKTLEVERRRTEQLLRRAISSEDRVQYQIRLIMIREKLYKFDGLSGIPDNESELEAEKARLEGFLALYQQNRGYVPGSKADKREAISKLAKINERLERSKGTYQGP